MSMKHINERWRGEDKVADVLYGNIFNLLKGRG